jgi:hypothetical protein
VVTVTITKWDKGKVGMMKISELKQRRFKVWVGGEVERTTNWKGVEKLLNNWSDYPMHDAGTRASIRAGWRSGIVYIDANITAQAI